MYTKLKTLEDVWSAVDAGLTVHWASDAYALVVVDSNLAWRKEQGFNVPFSNRGDKCLRVTCLSNYFGSLLEENELANLYVNVKE